MGLPGETSNDVRKTIDLLDELSQYKSIIIPLFFVPIGNLKEKGFFNKYKCTSEHWELLAMSFKHSLKWSYKIVEEEPDGKLFCYRMKCGKIVAFYYSKLSSSYPHKKCKICFKVKSE